MPNIKIIGGGLAGLIAAHHFKNAHVFEAGARLAKHKALLRFRSDSVANITGVPFRKVRVYKEVYYEGQSHQGKCPIALANRYAKKVTGTIAGRSIMKLDECDRFVAPDNLYELLADRLAAEGRLHFHQKITSDDFRRLEGDVAWINTAPLPVILNQLGLNQAIPKGEGMARSSIIVERFKIKTPCDVYQTIYFPDEGKYVFRASITGNILIIESVHNPSKKTVNAELQEVCAAFGLNYFSDIDYNSEVVDQRYGKIVDLPRETREAILYRLTSQHNIFSLGRFATWRNILLDDVADDLPKIERLINASAYHREKILKLNG